MINTYRFVYKEQLKDPGKKHSAQRENKFKKILDIFHIASFLFFNMDRVVVLSYV